jgi:hypothetical protein
LLCVLAGQAAEKLVFGELRVLGLAEVKGLTSRERRSLQLMLKLILGSGMPSHCSIDL